MNEKDYIERMKKEIDDLREKSDKLQVFVNENETFPLPIISKINSSSP